MDGHDKHAKPCGAWKLGLRFWTFGWMGMTNRQPCGAWKLGLRFWTFGWIGMINIQPGGAWKLKSFGIPL
jgi:hypothetical protein